MSFILYVEKNHPEFFDEGLMDYLGKNKAVRNAVMLGGLAAAGAGIGLNKNSPSGGESQQRPSASQEADSDAHMNRLPGTYEAGIRTFDEKGRPIKLSQEQQKKVDFARSLKKQMGGNSNTGGSSDGGSVIRKSTSDF